MIQSAIRTPIVRRDKDRREFDTATEPAGSVWYDGPFHIEAQMAS
jgi:hypothetical protein